MNSRDFLTSVMIRIMIARGHHGIKVMHQNTIQGRKKNDALLFRILKRNRNCAYGKQFHFEDIHSIEDYRRMVPLSNYSNYESYIQRMIDHDETNLITSLPLVGYSQSSGSVGTRKFVPLTKDSVSVYTNYTFTRMMANADRYWKAHGKSGLNPGRGVYTVPGYDEHLPNGLPCTNASDVPAQQLKFLYPYILITPFPKLYTAQQIDHRYLYFRFALEDPTTMYFFGIFFKDIVDYFKYLETNWSALLDDITNGTISEFAQADETTKAELMHYIKPNPERAALLRKEFEAGFDETIISRIWPNLQVINAIGTATFETFTDLARQHTKGIPFDYSIYGASEGLFAAADSLESKKQLLLLDSCYYEFIPEEDESQILSIDELEIGKRYEIVITNQSGLYRYRCGDVILVVDYLNECPYIQFVYRKGQLLNLTGEKTTEEHMRQAVHELEEKSGVRINHWVVYNSTEDYPFHYVLLVENEEEKDLSGYSAFLHEALKEINIRYAHFIGTRKIGPIQIRNLKYGTNKAWMQKQVDNGVPPSQVKPVRFLDTPEKLEFFRSKEINS